MSRFSSTKQEKTSTLIAWLCPLIIKSSPVDQIFTDVVIELIDAVLTGSNQTWWSKRPATWIDLHITVIYNKNNPYHNYHLHIYTVIGYWLLITFWTDQFLTEMTKIELWNQTITFCPENNNIGQFFANTDRIH